jgi:Fe-S cluster assembly protein SufD
VQLEDFAPASGGSASSGLPVLPAVAHALVDRIGDRSALTLSLDGEPYEIDLEEKASLAGVRLARASSHPEAEALHGRVKESFASSKQDATDELAAAFAQDGLVLTVPAGVVLDGPVVIVNVLGAEHRDAEKGPAFFPRTTISIGENAAATVIELFVSGPGAMLVLPVTELEVAQAGRLSYSCVQQLGRGTSQLAHSWARAGQEAHLKSFAASLGGHYARLSTDSRLDGPGGSAELLAAYLGDDDQMHDFRTLQEHDAPRTTSELFFKGAVGGSARAIYTGLIRMRRGARGANAFQTNRNLVLSEGAYAYSVPNLDIDENDVRCSHASAVGPVDKEQRFYLQSRGIPAEVAERLILLGYFAELLERAEPAVRDHVTATARDRLHALAEETS